MENNFQASVAFIISNLNFRDTYRCPPTEGKITSWKFVGTFDRILMEDFQSMEKLGIVSWHGRSRVGRLPTYVCFIIFF